MTVPKSTVAKALAEVEKIAADTENARKTIIVNIEAGAKKEIAAEQKAVSGQLSKLKAMLAPNLAHLSGQALAFYTVATHDLSKWEAAVATIGTGAVTTLVKKISAAIK